MVDWFDLKISEGVQAETTALRQLLCQQKPHWCCVVPCWWCLRAAAGEAAPGWQREAAGVWWCTPGPPRGGLPQGGHVCTSRAGEQGDGVLNYSMLDCVGYSWSVVWGKRGEEQVCTSRAGEGGRGVFRVFSVQWIT
jgi:hypothetical protein